MAKKYVKCLAPFYGVTVGKVYEIVEAVDSDWRFRLINDKGERDVWWLSPGQFELVESPSAEKENRQMKFSNKPGSAVVHYKSGETFHISLLTHLQVFSNDEDVLIDVTRTYSKDGLLFQERVGIPVHKFDKVVWINKLEGVNGTQREVEITYDESSKCLSYKLDFLTEALDFTDPGEVE